MARSKSVWQTIEDKILGEEDETKDAATNEPERNEDVGTEVKNQELQRNHEAGPSGALTLKPATSVADVTGQHLPTTLDFSFLLWKAVDKYGQADIISPVALFLAIGVVKAGARKKAADELQDSLNLPDDPIIAKMCLKMTRSLSLLIGENNPPGISLCSILSAPVSLNFRESFSEFARKVFQFETKNFDYNVFPQIAAHNVSEIVQTFTKDILVSFLKKSQVGKTTKLLLISVAVFKGTWKKEFHFPPINTRKEYFHNKDGSKIKVYMMAARANFHYAYIPQLHCSALGIPYDVIGCTFYAILPENESNFKKLQKNLTAEFILAVKSKLEQPTEVPIVAKLPKFISSTQINMVPILQRLGAETMFLPTAHFHGYFTNNQNAWFTNFYHQTHLEIHETGSECHHTSGQVLAPSTAVNFHANRPFIFMIMHDSTSAILLLGCVTHLATRGEEPKSSLK